MMLYPTALTDTLTETLKAEDLAGRDVAELDVAPEGVDQLGVLGWKAVGIGFDDDPVEPVLLSQVLQAGRRSIPASMSIFCSTMT